MGKVGDFHPCRRFGFIVNHYRFLGHLAPFLPSCGLALQSPLNLSGFLWMESSKEMLMMRLRALRHVVAPMAAAVLVSGVTCADLGTDPVSSAAGTTTTLIIVRHCERDAGFDPPLNAEGIARAQVLASVLAENGVSALYCSDFVRNVQSLEPVAALLGLEINRIPQLQLLDTKAFANNFVDTILPMHAGETVLWCGNTGPVLEEQSGNIQELYARLGGTGTAPIRYQDFTVVVIPEEGAGDVRFIKASYGGESSLD